MSHHKQPRTAAGLHLRALRESCGKSQFEVELDGNLGIGYLQRLELGKVQQPERDTLNRILDVLQAGFIQRRDLLALFGYAASMTVPNLTEIQAAITAFHAEVSATIPIYLLDCTHRLLAWNTLIPKLFGELQNTQLIPKLVFDSSKGIAGAVANPDAFFAAQVRIIHYEKQRFGDETWYGDFVNEMRDYPIFARYWDQQTRYPQPYISIRPFAPLLFDTGSHIARFHLIAETAALDPRFRLIYYLPDDIATMQQCLAWQNAESV